MTFISSIVSLTKRPPAATPLSYTVYRGNGGSSSFKRHQKGENISFPPIKKKKERGENSPLYHVTSVGRSFPFLTIWAGKRCVADRPPLKSCPKKKRKGGRRRISPLFSFLGGLLRNFVGNRSDVAKWSGSKSRTCVNDRLFPKIKIRK